MVKPNCLKKGDKVAIITLSRGLLGMPFCKHELDLGIKRMKELGLEPVIMPNSLNDMEYTYNHPEKRAEDLKRAFLDDEIKGFFTAIGGDDAYKTIPYLMEDVDFKNAVLNHPKIFMGFSDTTWNHLMLNKIGLSTFYGPAFLVDIAELDKKMLPYTLDNFNKVFGVKAPFEITSSDIWYYDRKSYAEDQLGISRDSHKEEHGYEVLNGSGSVTGKLYGGCIESFYGMFTGDRYKEENNVIEKYNILPSIEEWKEKILFIETCEETIEPSKLEIILNIFKEKKILESVQGVIVGKPMDEIYYEEYKQVYKRVFSDLNTPVLYNVNFGHAVPRCIIPYDALATIDLDNKKIIIRTDIFND